MPDNKKTLFNADLSLNTTHIEDSYSSDPDLQSRITYNSYEAARSNFFVFSVAPDQLTNLYHLGENPDAEDANRYDEKTASDYLRLSVVKASVPNFKVEPKEFRRGNDVVKFAGVPTFSDGSLTVDDMVGLHVKDMLYSWLYLAYNPHTRKGGRMKDYKKVATLSEYTQDYVLIRTWTLFGCFITGIDEGEFDREGGDEKRQLTVAISYDRAIMEPAPESK